MLPLLFWKDCFVIAMVLFVFQCDDGFPAFFGQPVFLQAAVGLFGDGALDEFGIQKASDLFVQFAGDCGMAKHRSEFGFAFRALLK